MLSSVSIMAKAASAESPCWTRPATPSSMRLSPAPKWARRMRIGMRSGWATSVPRAKMRADRTSHSRQSPPGSPWGRASASANSAAPARISCLLRKWLYSEALLTFIAANRRMLTASQPFLLNDAQRQPLRLLPEISGTDGLAIRS